MSKLEFPAGLGLHAGLTHQTIRLESNPLYIYIYIYIYIHGLKYFAKIVIDLLSLRIE